MTNEEPRTIPSPHEFLLEVPLYKSFPFDPNGYDYKELGELKYFMENIDCYCMTCQKESVFQALKQPGYDAFMAKIAYEEREELTANHIFKIELFCSRDTSHRIHYIFSIEDNNITKIGQYPSMADLSSEELQRYRKVLPADLFAEYNRAIGLVSHGVGIGAFVYLRRIFEKLISEAYERAITSGGWDEDKYVKSRMEEKIGLLKDFLPPFLIKNKNIYSILSKGIHELSEEECKKFFPIIKAGIELILEEKIAEKKQEDTTKTATKAIADLHQTLK